jgi:hypothetical protein
MPDCKGRRSLGCASMRFSIPFVPRRSLLRVPVMAAAFLCQTEAAPYEKAERTGDELQEFLLWSHLKSSGQLPALRQLSRPKQLRWIQQERSYDPSLSYRKQDGGRGPEFRTLLALNDTETARWLIGQYSLPENHGAEILQTLAEWHTAEGIAFMAARTLSEEPFVMGMDNPESFRASMFLLDRMLPNAGDLPMPVRNWAGKLAKALLSSGQELLMAGGETSDASRRASFFLAERRREIAQRWWRANEKAVLAGKWQEVQPGEGYNTPEFRAFLVQLGGQKTVDGSEPKGASASDAVTASSPSAFSGQSYRWIAAGLLAAFLATVAGWLLVRSKRKK